MIGGACWHINAGNEKNGYNHCLGVRRPE